MPRREADEFIQQGLVKVNGQVVTELGTKITHSDVVEYDEKVVTMQRQVLHSAQQAEGLRHHQRRPQRTSYRDGHRERRMP